MYIQVHFLPWCILLPPYHIMCLPCSENAFEYPLVPPIFTHRYTQLSHSSAPLYLLKRGSLPWLDSAITAALPYCSTGAHRRCAALIVVFSSAFSFFTFFVPASCLIIVPSVFTSVRRSPRKYAISACMELLVPLLLATVSSTSKFWPSTPQVSPTVRSPSTRPVLISLLLSGPSADLLRVLSCGRDGCNHHNESNLRL